MRHHEISPTGAIIEKLEVAAGHTCKVSGVESNHFFNSVPNEQHYISTQSAWLQKKQNGFKGYFNLWRKMMGDAP